jgi:hypothetical protein
MIKYMKESRLCVTRYLCGKPLRSKSRLVKTRGGFPVHFLYLKGLIDSGNLLKIKFVLSLFNITRGLDPSDKEDEKILPDYKSITNDYTGKEYYIPASFIKSFVRTYKLGLRIPI